MQLISSKCYFKCMNALTEDALFLRLYITSICTYRCRRVHQCCKKMYYFESVNTVHFGIRETVAVVVDGPNRMLPSTAGNAEIPPFLSIS